MVAAVGSIERASCYPLCHPYNRRRSTIGVQSGERQGRCSAPLEASSFSCSATSIRSLCLLSLLHRFIFPSSSDLQRYSYHHRMLSRQITRLRLPPPLAPPPRIASSSESLGAFVHPSRLARPSSLTFRALSTSYPRSAQYPPPPPGGGGGGGGRGHPLGNIFGQQEREPGAALKEHGVDITEIAKQGGLDPVIGRDEEIKRTIQILSRRTKVGLLAFRAWQGDSRLTCNAPLPTLPHSHRRRSRLLLLPPSRSASRSCFPPILLLLIPRHLAPRTTPSSPERQEWAKPPSWKASLNVSSPERFPNRSKVVVVSLCLAGCIQCEDWC